MAAPDARSNTKLIRSANISANNRRLWNDHGYRSSITTKMRELLGSNTESFVSASVELHGNKYDYSNMVLPNYL